MHYLKHVKFGSYKSFQSLDVKLNKGLNIVIGPNGSGKSNFLEILKISMRWLPKELYKFGMPYSLFVSFADFDSEQTYKVDLYIKQLNEGKSNSPSSKDLYSLISVQPTLKLFIDDSLTHESEEPTFLKILESTLTLDIHEHLNVSNIDNVRIGYGLMNNQAALDVPMNISVSSNFKYESVENTDYSSNQTLAGVALYYCHRVFEDQEKVSLEASQNVKSSVLSGIEEFFFARINTSLREVTNISEVRLNDSLRVVAHESEIRLENLQLEFLVNEKWLSWNELSDGTKRLFIIVTQIALTIYNVILLEEPELGIHPHQLTKLMTFIKERSEHQQIILTTHSPQVLDVLKKDELDSIILCEMTEEGSKLRHLEDQEKKKAIYYMENDAFLSDYWRFSDLETV